MNNLIGLADKMVEALETVKKWTRLNKWGDEYRVEIWATQAACDATEAYQKARLANPAALGNLPHGVMNGPDRWHQEAAATPSEERAKLRTPQYDDDDDVDWLDP